MVGEGDGVGLAVRSRHRGVATVYSSGEQGQTLVGRGLPDERPRGEGLEVLGLEQLLTDVGSAVGRVGGVVGDRAVVVDEANETGVLHAGLLGFHRRPQYTLGNRYVAGEFDGIEPRGDRADQGDRTFPVSAGTQVGPQAVKSLVEV